MSLKDLYGYDYLQIENPMSKKNPDYKRIYRVDLGGLDPMVDCTPVFLDITIGETKKRIFLTSWRDLFVKFALFLIDELNINKIRLLNYEKEWSTQALYCHFNVENSIKIMEGLYLHNTTEASQSRKTFFSLLKYLNLDVNNYNLYITKSFYRENKKFLEELEKANKESYLDFLYSKYDKRIAESYFKHMEFYDNNYAKNININTGKVDKLKGASIFVYDLVRYTYSIKMKIQEVARNHNKKINIDIYDKCFNDYYEWFRKVKNKQI